MIIKNLKADLSENAQNKLKAIIADAVEAKVQREIKKLAKKLTVSIVMTGAVLAGVCILASNSDKLVTLVAKPKK